jgi:hypothetical protein
MFYDESSRTFCTDLVYFQWSVVCFFILTFSLADVLLFTAVALQSDHLMHPVCVLLYSPFEAI